jgi:glycosyltransferase involved in cell wall biosynthesis
MPKLSVVIAAQDAGLVLDRCIAALLEQRNAPQMEILVASCDQEAEFRSADLQNVRFLRADAPASVPALWTLGIRVASGVIIALTIENCVPEPDWASRMVEAHQTECAAAGGAIEPNARAGIADWAIYFCRYSSYMLPFSPRFLDDLAADNCSYKRQELDSVMHLAGDGFWEALIHADMRKAGRKLYCDPAIVVRWAGGISFSRFLLRRFRHGRYFAARRSMRFTFGQRIARAFGAPAVPLLLLNRIATITRSKGRHFPRFLISFPLILCFLASWAAGEGVGYLTGAPAAAAPVD